MYDAIKKHDKDIYNVLLEEERRQAEGLELIPSENIVSQAVREASGSCLTNKYSEGYPHARYYGGNEVIDKVEDIARERAPDARVEGERHEHVLQRGAIRSKARRLSRP